MSKIFINSGIAAKPINDMGIEVPASGQLEIDPTQYTKLAASSDAVALLADPEITFNNGLADVVDLAKAVRYLQGDYGGEVSILDQPAFASKILPNGRKLFNRTHGQHQDEVLNLYGYPVILGNNTIEFPVLYNEAKFNELEIIGGQIGDVIDLYVVDRPASADPDLQPLYGADMVLNQFGFKVSIAEKFYHRKSSYDADLYKAMRIRLIYRSIAVGHIYPNAIFHEVKP